MKFKKVIRVLSNPVTSTSVAYRKFIVYVLYKRYLLALGKKVFIGNPLLFTAKYISVGSHVFIWPNCRIEGITQYNTSKFAPEIYIKDFVTIQQNLHLTCAKKITIGENTAIAANVTITDINHQFENISLPPEKQDIDVMEVVIGPSCKIYNNVVILPGVKLGKHNIVGANSVVQKGSYPDYCVIAGNPGHIKKKYCESSKMWRKTDRNGNFLN